MPRIKYKENCSTYDYSRKADPTYPKIRAEGYFDFCRLCWAARDLWLDRFLNERMDIDLESVEAHIDHPPYAKLGYLCLNCQEKLTDDD